MDVCCSGHCFSVMVWFTGGFEKYPDLLVLLFFIYYAVVAPALLPSTYERKWKELEKRRRNAVNADNSPEAASIEEKKGKLESYNTPLTLGHLNTFRAELDERVRAVESILNLIHAKIISGSDNNLAE